MTALDLVLIAAIAVFVVAWWVRAAPGRAYVLLGAALIALGAGIVDVADQRWQAAFGVAAGAIFLTVLAVNRLRKAPAKAGVPFVSGVLFALIGFIAFAPIWLFPVDPLPKPSGQYAVGVRSFDVVDESRRGVIAAGADEPRRLAVRVWYPAQSVSGAPRPYFTDAEAVTTGTGMGSLFGFPQLYTFLKHVRTNSYENAPLLEGARDLPVAIYSHGYTSFLSQNTVLMEELASHGYIVYSLQHTYDSSPTVFADGSVAPMDPALMNFLRAGADGAAPDPAQRDAMAGETLDARMEGRLVLTDRAIAERDRIARSGPIWVADRIFLHDQLQQGAVPEDVRAIVAAGNLARVGEMGMSFGGASSMALCYVDTRCAAAINLDGGDFHITPVAADIPVPALMFHSDMAYVYESMGAPVPASPRGYNEFSYETFEHAGGRVTRVQLLQTRHMGLSDFSLFTRRPLRDGLLGAAPPAVMIGAQNDFVRGFFDLHVRGQANGFPQPQMAAYEGWAATVDNSDVPAWWAGLTEERRAAIVARIDAAKAAFAAQ